MAKNKGGDSFAGSFFEEVSSGGGKPAVAGDLLNGIQDLPDDFEFDDNDNDLGEPAERDKKGNALERDEVSEKDTKKRQFQQELENEIPELDDNKKTRQERQEVENEEEIDEENEEEEEENDEDDDENESDDISFTPLASRLIEKGIFKIDPKKEYEDSEEGFEQIAKDTVELTLQEHWNSVPEDYRSLHDHLISGKPLAEWVSGVEKIPYHEAELDDPETQEYLVRKQLELQGVKAEKIEERIERFKKLKLLKDESKDAQEFLVEYENQRHEHFINKVKQDRIEAEKKAEETAEKIKKEIFETKEIAGFELTKQDQLKLNDYINKPVGPKGETQYMIDRNKNIVKAAFLSMRGYDTEKVRKIAKSEADREVRKEVRKYNDKNSKGGGRTVREGKNNPISDFDFGF